MRVLRLLALAAVLTVAAPAWAQPAKPSGLMSSGLKPSGLKPAGLSQKSQSKNDNLLGRLPPLVFYVAKGEPNACGDGCDTWIAAEGAFDMGAAKRFRDFLKRQGDRKLPVYFHSPGGIAGQAMDMGRLMRQRKMTAGVARTIPQGCDPTKDKDEPCDALKRSGRELPAELRSARTLCNSACVYALIGAVARQVAPGARLGVHASKVLSYRGAYGKSVRPGTAAQIREHNAELRRYILEMGIDAALHDAAEEISHERVRYLSRDEIARFRIDTREFQDSRWMVDEGPPGPMAIIKFVTEAKGPDSKEYRVSRIRMSCVNKDFLLMEYGRELGSDEKSGPLLTLAAGEQKLNLEMRRGRTVVGYNNISMDDRSVRLPVAFLKSAAAADNIEIAEGTVLTVVGWELPQNSKPKSVVKLSTAGLSGSLDALLERCR